MRNRTHMRSALMKYDVGCRRLIESAAEPFKLEILEGIKTEPITVYGIGEDNAQKDGFSPGFRWWDLCAGPHLERTGQVNPKAVELMSIAGAYWRGDETQPMLQASAQLPNATASAVPGC